jgi:hypothetical protein
MGMVTRAVCGVTVVATLLLAGAGCGGGDDGDEADAVDDGDAEEEGAGDDGGAGGAEAGAVVGEPELRRELLDMQEDDQAEREGQPVEEWQDEARTERLAEIIDEHGWPTRTLVGDDGATAAWLIAQHSDLYVDFQDRALELMRAAVADGEADATELAYLEDRVTLNSGRPQIYGTQISCVDGHAEPSELADPNGVEELREQVGLQPFDDYLAELEPACQEEASSGAGG